MRLGIDLGTTRTIVAAHDRGNFPVVGFTSSSGDLCDHYPTVTAEVEGALVHGLDAEAAALAGAPALRSWKRLLHDLGPQGLVRVGRVEVPALELVTGFLSALRRDLFLRSNLPRDLCDPLEAAVSVPANAHCTQRFLTLEAFRRAGFAVLRRPQRAHAPPASSTRTATRARSPRSASTSSSTTSAAAPSTPRWRPHRRRATRSITTSGVSQLGGDDFDEALLEMALTAAASASAAIADAQRARRAPRRVPRGQGALHPTSRRIVSSSRARRRRPRLADGPRRRRYYERTRPLVERTMAALEPVLRR